MFARKRLRNKSANQSPKVNQQAERQKSETMMNFLSIGVAASACVACFVSLSSTFMNTPAPASPDQVRETMMQLGMNAETLAAAGVTPTEVPAVMANIADRYDQVQALRGYAADLLIAQASMESLAERLRQDAGDDEAVASMQSASSQADAAVASIRAAKISLLAAALQGRGDVQSIPRLFLGDDGAGQLDPAYRYAVSSEDEANTLAWALKTVRLADARGNAAPSDATAAVSAAEGLVQVQLAKQFVAQHAAGIQAAIAGWEGTD